jgi:hypothetical protein
MLNLPVAMHRLLFALWTFFFVIGPLRVPAQQVVIVSPHPGEALQGQVIISGTTDLEGFQSYTVDFAYQQDATGTWFPIYQGKDVVKAGALATWDTTTISDGVYRVRVMVFLTDGRAVQTVISGLRVRNYTAVETSTPAPLATVEGQPTAAPADYIPGQTTLTPSDENPAQVSGMDLSGSLALGGLVALGLFVLLGFYLAVRALFRRF